MSAEARLRRAAAEFNNRMNLSKCDSLAGKPASRAIIIKAHFAGYARRCADN
jgi:hypothetical protein